MQKLFDYARIVALLLGLLIGVQIPGFVDEYRQLLEARVMESNSSVSEFQDDADRFFDGDIEQLIAYYQSRDDLVIISGGESIEALVARNRSLVSALARFNQSLVHAYLQAFLSPVPEVQDQLRDSYEYRVTLNASSIGTGVGLAILAMMIFELLIFLLRKCLHLLYKFRKSGKRQEGPEKLS